MSTQYDQIVNAYETVSNLPGEQIEHKNVERSIQPHLQGSKVLELACGLGMYTRRFIDMGATHVLALDISSGMIEAAKVASASPPYKSKIEYQVADCSKPTRFDEGPFDLVFAAYLLNYAPDEKTLSDSFRMASLNLKPGGIFLGTTVPPAEDPKKRIETLRAVRPKQKGILWTTILGAVEDGCKINLMALTEEKEEDNVGFDNYHLRESVYGRAAKAGGFGGGLEWERLEWPEELSGSEREEWLRTYVTEPETGIFVARKR